MNENEIEINGITYIKKELLSEEKINNIFNKVIYFEGAVIETDKYAFEATVLLNKDIKSINIEFSDKSKSDWRNNTDYWDNSDYFEELINKERESIKILMKDIPEKKERNNFINFLKELKNKNWF